MNNTLIARAQVDVSAPTDRVWDALVEPAQIQQYMFGTTVISDWKEGSDIIWKGDWKGKPYEDKGKLLKFQPRHLLQYTHFSPLTGQPDVPENYHTVTLELIDKGDSTCVVLAQDNNSTTDDQRHSEETWSMMLDGLKKFLES